MIDNQLRRNKAVQETEIELCSEYENYDSKKNICDAVSDVCELMFFCVKFLKKKKTVHNCQSHP